MDAPNIFEQYAAFDRQAKEIQAKRAAEPKPVTAPTVEVSDEWPAPLPLPDNMPPAPPLTPEMLPQALADWVFDIAHRMQCPPDFPATAALVALGTVVGKKIRIYPKRQDSWDVVPNVWGMAEGRPGVLKSPAVKAAFAPLFRLAQIEREESQKDVNAHVGQVEALQAKIKAAAKKPEIAATLKGELAALKEKAPAVRRLVTNDATIEKLGMMLNENPNGLLIEREELTGLFHQMEQQGHEQDRSFYLEAWDGRNSKSIDRVLRGSLWVPSCVLSLYGTIQPGPLERYLERFYAEQQTDGFIERFQLAVYPDVREWSFVDEAPNQEAFDRVWDIFTRLYNMGGDHVVHFSPAAQPLFVDWLTRLEAVVRDPAVHPLLRSHLSKYRSLMPSLALLFQLVASNMIRDVGVKPTQVAIQWCDYLAGHAERIYWPVVRPEGAAIHLLAARLPAMAGEVVTARDLARNGWTGLKGAGLVTEALERLATLHWVRPEAAGRWGNQVCWAVSPSLSSLSVNSLKPGAMILSAPLSISQSMDQGT